jgi:hypothetical protein
MFLATYSFTPAIRMLKRMNLAPIVQKVYKLSECKQAYEDQISGKYAKIRVRLRLLKIKGVFRRKPNTNKRRCRQVWQYRKCKAYRI